MVNQKGKGIYTFSALLDKRHAFSLRSFLNWTPQASDYEQRRSSNQETRKILKGHLNTFQHPTCLAQGNQPCHLYNSCVQARDVNLRGTDAASSLGFPNVLFHHLDVLDSLSVHNWANFLTKKLRNLDILVGLLNACFLLSHSCFSNCLLTSCVLTLQWKISGKDMREQLGNANAETVSENKLDDILKRFLQDYKDDDLNNGSMWSSVQPAYNISKAAVNGYSRILTKWHPEMKINCVHAMQVPGFMSTDLNYHKATMTVKEGARCPVKCALLPDNGPSGCYFYQTQVASF
ncbi:unnamed protein product [Linum trigynum]|uniref:Uncharacterized protein n=2 Tax=Linum trigynum TaxID=586398 RepID=A0AAV2FZ22_9ROSI